MKKGCNCLKGKQLDIRLNKGKLLAGKGDRQTSLKGNLCFSLKHSAQISLCKAGISLERLDL